MANSSILLLTTPFRPNIGGVETHLDDLIKEGTKKNLSFYVLTYQPLITKAWGKSIEKAKGLVIYRIPWLRMNLFLKLEKYPALEFLYLFPALFLCGLVFMIIKGREIKVVHSQGLVAGAVGVVLGNLFNKKVLISTHSIYHFPKKGLYRQFVKFLFDRSSKVLTLSEQSKSEVINLGLSESKVSVFRYWVNQEIFKPMDQIKARKILNLPNSFICLFVGRLVEVKGINELLNAAQLMKNECIFLIVGDGPLSNQIRMVESRDTNLIFRESIDNDELPLYYNAADVLIVPSTHEEGFGRVILEALSCGLPVIGSNRGAIPDAINEKVGVIIDITPENIEKTITKLIIDRSILIGLAKNSRGYAEKRYNSKNLQLITKYYD